MPYYLIQTAFTPEAWASHLKNPQDPRERHQAMFEKLGGSLEGYWYAFGDYDVIAIAQVPDNVSAETIYMAAMATGAVKDGKFTPLMTVEEGLEAMKNAGSAGYKPPSS